MSTDEAKVYCLITPAGCQLAKVVAAQREKIEQSTGKFWEVVETHGRGFANWNKVGYAVDLGTPLVLGTYESGKPAGAFNESTVKDATVKVCGLNDAMCLNSEPIPYMMILHLFPLTFEIM